MTNAKKGEPIMENIEYSKTADLAVRSDTAEFEISFYKDKTFFMVFDNYVNYIKGIEKTIRQSDDYTNYISHLKELGLTRCQVLGNVDSNMSKKGHRVSVEMHHGPIFTLFDYCGAIITHMVKHDMPITTPRIAKIVMDEHWAGNVQTVMLSSSVHQALDSDKIFISLKQAHGNLNNFIKKYEDGILENQKLKINKYIEMSEQYKSTDNGIFELKETMHDWSHRRLL